MKCLVTGVKGQLGYDIVRELNSRGYTDVLGLDYDAMDITSKDQVKKVIAGYMPDVIFHCAAYTQVDKAEEDQDKCVRVNVEGTKNIMEVAKAIDSKLIYISTDYVFDGEKNEPYEVNDKANPRSIYGNTKYLGELEALRNNKTFVVRISWVFGINGSNFVKTMLRLAETKTELNVVCDQIGSPTYTVDLSRLLVDMSETEKYGVYHATNEGFISWYEFAKAIFETNNIEMKVNAIPASSYPTKAERPYNSRLSKQSLIDNGFKQLPTWEDALDRYNEELKNEENLVKKI